MKNKFGLMVLGVIVLCVVSIVSIVVAIGMQVKSESVPQPLPTKQAVAPAFQVSDYNVCVASLVLYLFNTEDIEIRNEAIIACDGLTQDEYENAKNEAALIYKS